MSSSDQISRAAAQKKAKTKHPELPPQLEVSSANGTLSMQVAYVKSGGLFITKGSGQSTSTTGEAVYEGEKVPDFRDRPEQVPQYFVLHIQDATARLILTKDARGRAEVVFDNVYEGIRVPRLDGVYAGSWRQVFIPDM